MLNFCLNCGNEEIESSKFCFNCGSELTDISPVDILSSGILLDKRYKILSLYKDLPPLVRNSGSHSYKIQYLTRETPGGILYIAEDIRFKNSCLVKELILNHDIKNLKKYTDSIRKEIQVFCNIRHPSITAITNYFIERGRHYLVMDYFEGKSLEKILEKEGKPGLDQKFVIPWAMQILDMLDYLHSQEPPVIYRNINPATIILKDSDKKVVFFDFYISSLNSDVRGILPAGICSAPEEKKGEFNMRSDLFSLGATMYYLLTGHKEDFSTYKVKPIKEVLPDIHPSLDRIINTCLSPDPAYRYESASYMKKDLFKTSKLHSKKTEDMERDAIEQKKEITEKIKVLSADTSDKVSIKPPTGGSLSVDKEQNPSSEDEGNKIKSSQDNKSKIRKTCLVILTVALIVTSVVFIYWSINKSAAQNIFNEGLTNFKHGMDGKSTYYNSQGKMGYELTINDYKKAIADFENYIKIKENYPEAYYMMGQAYYGIYDIDMLKSDFEDTSIPAENLGKASEEFKKAIFYYPEYVEAHYYLARCYYHQGDWEKTREELNKSGEFCNNFFTGDKKTRWLDNIKKGFNSFLVFTSDEGNRSSAPVVKFINETDSDCPVDFKGKNNQNLSVPSHNSLSTDFKEGEYACIIKMKKFAFCDKVKFETGKIYTINIKKPEDTFVNIELAGK